MAPGVGRLSAWQAKLAKPLSFNFNRKDAIMTVEKTVEALCEQHRKDGGDPQAATVLSLVTWEEIYTAVCNMLNDMGLLP